MSGVLKVLLLTSFALLGSTQTWENYKHLPDDWRTHIKKALENANSIFGKEHHVNYHGLASTPRITERSVNFNVFLKVTTCKQDQDRGYDHWDECKSRKIDSPWIDCLVCKNDSGEEIIDCATYREVKNKKRDGIREKCKSSFPGAHTLFSTSWDSEKQYGCVGCI